MGNLAIIENGDIAFDFKNQRAAYHTLQTIMVDPPVVQEMLIIENSTEVRKSKTLMINDQSINPSITRYLGLLIMMVVVVVVVVVVHGDDDDDDDVMMMIIPANCPSLGCKT